jgi:zinc protease
LRRIQLDNGLKVVALPNQYPKDRFYMYLDVQVGSMCEAEDEQGIAHFLEHVVFLGTEKWKTPEEMREKMAELGMSFGGDTNASTDQKSTIYTMEAPSGNEQTTLVTEILYQVKTI